MGDAATKTSDGKNFVVHATITANPPQLRGEVLTPEVADNINEMLKSNPPLTRLGRDAFILTDANQNPIQLIVGHFSENGRQFTMAYSLPLPNKEAETAIPQHLGTKFTFSPDGKFDGHVTAEIADAIQTIPAKEIERKHHEEMERKRMRNTRVASLDDQHYVFIVGRNKIQNVITHTEQNQVNLNWGAARRQIEAHPELFQKSDSPLNTRVLAVTDEKGNPQRLFVARYDTNKDTHATTISLLRSLDLDPNANPKSVKDFDKPIEVKATSEEMHDGTGLKKAADAIQKLIAADRVVQIDKPVGSMAKALEEFHGGTHEPTTAPLKPAIPGQKSPGANR